MIPNSLRQDNRILNGVSNKVVIGWWGVTLFFVAIFLFRPDLQKLADVGIYFGLWMIISLACLYFIKRWSFSARLGLPFDILETPVYLTFTLLVLISLFGMAPYFDEGYLLNRVPSVSELPKGLMLTGVGLICLWLGYALGVIVLPRYSRSVHLATTRSWLNFHNPSLLKTLVVYFVLALIRVILIGYGGGEGFGKTIQFGNWSQWIIYLVELRWFFIALFLLQGISKRWPRTFTILVIVFEISMVVISGWTSSLLKIGFLVFGCMAYYGKRPSLRLGFVIGFALVFLTPIVRDSRGMNFSSTETVFDRFGSSIEKYWTMSDKSVSFTQDLLIARQTTIAQTQAVFLHLVPSIVPYRPITELFVIPLYLIPRVLWPYKPIVGGLGVFVNIVFLGAPITSNSSAALTMPGNAYLYGGWPVVIAVMFIIGMLLAVFYRLVAVPARLDNQVGLLALYAGTMIAVFHIGEVDILGVWSGLVQRGVVFFLVLVFLCMDNRPAKIIS